jgi:hypothetical protein
VNSKISNVGGHVDRRSFPEAIAPVVAVEVGFACAEGKHVEEFLCNFIYMSSIKNT